MKPRSVVVGACKRAGCRALCVLLLFVLPSCTEDPQWTNSETHFLQMCETSADCCGEAEGCDVQFECICHSCSLPCNEVGVCGSHFPHLEAVCNALSGTVSSELCFPQEKFARPNACLPSCRFQKDCDRLPQGAALVCARGVCVHAPELSTTGRLTIAELEPNDDIEHAQSISAIGNASVGWLWPRRDLSGGPTVEGRLDPINNEDVEDDRDYFTFEAQAGTWIAIVIEANTGDILGEIDTVLTLLDSSEVEIAMSNDAIDTFRGTPFGEPKLFPELDGNGLHYDTELVVRIPRDDTYYLLVEDSTGRDESRTYNQAGDYRLYVGRFGRDTEGVTIDPEPGDGPGAVSVIANRTEMSLVLGTLRDLSDIDVFARRVDRSAILHTQVGPYGPDGFGTAPLNLRVTSTVDESTIARLVDEAYAVAPPVPSGEYHVWVSPAADAVESGAYYVLKQMVIEETEVDGENNDQRAGATPIPLSDDSAWFWLTLDENDVDYLSFDPVDVDRFGRVQCWSRVDGSGVSGLNVSLLMSNDELIESATEAPPRPASILGDEMSSETGYQAAYLRLTKADQDEGVSGQWVHCFFSAH